MKMETLQTIGYVYLVTNLVNGKKYVGCTSWTVQRRWRRHITLADSGSPQLVHKAIRKHGRDNFHVEVLEEVRGGGRKDLIKAEKHYISKQACIAPEGYNLTSGGEGADFSVAAFREKHFASMQQVYADPEWRASIARANRKKSNDPNYRAVFLTAMQKMHSDPEYQLAHANSHHKMAENPEWQKFRAAQNRKMASDPSWQKAHTKAMRSRAKDPEWRKRNAEAMRKLAKNPEWLSKVRENGLKGGALATAKALERDALLSEEERARRIKNRAYGAKHRAKKRMLLDA